MFEIEENQKVNFLRMRFYWEEGEFIFYIRRKDGGFFTPKDIEDLLDEYKKTDEYYNGTDWADFLEEKGFKVEMVDFDYSMYF